MKNRLSTNKRAIRIGISCYFLCLILILIIVIILINDYTILIFGRFPVNILIVEVLLSLPAIPSSFVACELSEKRNSGIRTVIISGFITISLISLIIIIFLIVLFLNPSISSYEDLIKAGLFIAVVYFYTFFIFPISVMSMIYAVSIEQLWYSSKSINR